MAQLTPASDAARHYSRAHTEQFRHELHELMRLPVIMMGYRLDDDGLHGPNERLSIEMFHRGVETAISALGIWRGSRAAVTPPPRSACQ